MSERGTCVHIIVLAVAGLLMSAYLTWVHLLGLSPMCLAGNSDCETVQSSRYAEILGVPVAALGVGGYAVLLLSALLKGEGGALLGLFVTLISVIFSAYLMYLELFSSTPLASGVSSAALMTAAFMLCVIRVDRLRKNF